MATVVK
ncbi:hypothetical protein D049_0014A, partial [Vibrio parahaemolyticus VPTS-2010]